MTRKSIVFAVVLISLGIGQSTYAKPVPKEQRCEASIFTLVGKQLGVGNFSDLVTAGACKIWQKNSVITIAAFAYEDESEVNGKSLVIAMIDQKRGKVVASYKGAQIDFANFGVVEEGLRIDTARYDVGPGTRAFGLDIAETYNHNCASGGTGPSRTLFVQNGSSLKPVLENFFLSTWRLVNDGHTCMSEEDGEPKKETVSYLIGVGSGMTNGYANLLITATSSSSSKKPFQYEFHYDGNQYQVSSHAGRDLDKWRNAP